jgi:hypothetical protein
VLATCIASNAAAIELILPPGASVTILDAEDPAVRIVMTAPPNQALDLSELLTLRPEESVRSIVTRFQASYAGSMSRNADGSITLGPSGPAQTRAPTPGLAGGVLVRNGDKWMLHPGGQQQAAAQPPKPAPAQQGTQRQIYKAGTTREQAERDIAECRKVSEKASSPLMSAPDKANAFNNAMYSCLRSFGYEIRG